MTKALVSILTLFVFACSVASAQSDPAPRFANTVIEPGSSVGPLKLGDSRDHALQLFPKKDEDQSWDDPCGSTLDWVDTTNPIGWTYPSHC